MNASQRLVAWRYAQAYDQLSTSTKQATQYAAQLEEASTLLSPVQSILKSPQVSSHQKKEAVQAALKELPQAAALIGALLEAKRYNLWEEVCAQVNVLLDERAHISRAQVVSAEPLTQAQQAATQHALEARYGGRVEATFQTEPSLLGGLKISCHGELLDGSLRRQLEKLQTEISK